MKTQSSKAMALILGAALLLCASNSQAWWNKEWTIRKKIDIDTSTAGAPIADPIGTTAILIRLHDGNFRFTEAKEDGSDLRFVAADDKTLLDSSRRKVRRAAKRSVCLGKNSRSEAGRENDLLDVLRQRRDEGDARRRFQRERTT